MEMVLLTALGIGGATVTGALLGFVFKKPSQRMNDMILSFAAGIMLCAAIIGLILPSLNSIDSPLIIIITVLGIVSGALCMHFIDMLVPHLHKMTGVDRELHPEKNEQLSKVLLFVLAIAIHNLPEGIAAGVSFGNDNVSGALSVALGIALQNIPEGMVIIAPMLASGIKPGRTFIIAISTGLVEVVGTLLGYLSVSIASAILPFALAFAGGTMIYVISDEMIPETHSHGNECAATYSLIAGFAVMLIFDFLIG